MKNYLGVFTASALLLFLTACSLPDIQSRLFPDEMKTRSNFMNNLKPSLSSTNPDKTLQSVILENTIIPDVTQMTSTASSTSSRCNQAAAGVPFDLTISDGSKLEPGEFFTKTWRLVNTGTCQWTQNYAVVWLYGNLTIPRNIKYLNDTVSPGESIDIEVEMTAPSQTGEYLSYWKLQSVNGEKFGIGPQSASPFWVRIEVIENRTSTPSITPSVTPTIPVYSRGAIFLEIDSSIDLDSGALNTGLQDDLSLKEIGQEVALVPRNGTHIGLFGSQVPKLNECFTSELSMDPLLLGDNIQKNNYLCYRSSQDFPGYLYLIMLDNKSNSIGLEYLTWSIP